MGKVITSKSSFHQHPVLSGAKRERVIYQAWREDGSMVTYIHAVDWYHAIHTKGLLERPPGSPEPEPEPEQPQGEVVVDVIEEMSLPEEEIIDDPIEQPEEPVVGKSTRKIKRS